MTHSPALPPLIAADVDAAIYRWQAELVDVSRANRLIHWSRRGGLQIAHPTPADLYDGLAGTGRTYVLYEPDPPRETEELDPDDPTPEEPEPEGPPRPPRANEIARRRATPQCGDHSCPPPAARGRILPSQPA